MKAMTIVGLEQRPAPPAVSEYRGVRPEVRRFVTVAPFGLIGVQVSVGIFHSPSR